MPEINFHHFRDTTLLGLNNLKWLDIRGTKISDLSPLSGMDELQELNLDYLQISDPSQIAVLKSQGVKVNQFVSEH
ncbi:leucine-rich repeat domain-containing protein [Profundibacter sp.]|uniref:leucine-rich repeat domain-containing protein n=1 Tax=Profundibacter sp. TaxID=3101071 RepID=UPI003D128950